MACTQNGDKLFVADNGNNRLRMVDTKTGDVKTVAGNGKRESMDGIGLDAGVWHPRKPVFYRSPTAKPDSILFFTSTGSVRRFDIESGAVSTLKLKPALLIPWGIDCTPSGHLIVSCAHTNSIYSVDPRTGDLELLVGSGLRTRGFTDGSGSAARFNSPLDLVVSDSGRCAYVADKQNNRIRRMKVLSRLFRTARNRKCVARYASQSQPIADTVTRALSSATSVSNQQTPSESADRADAKSAMSGQASNSPQRPK